jgi:hypothetical protein
MPSREVTLPSGRVLTVNPAPFHDAKKLYQAIGGEALRVQIIGEDDLSETIKNVICLGSSSLAIEQALNPCMKRCLYQGVKIDDRSFEPEEAREDYLDICVEVAKENLRPFTKSLFAQFKGLLGLVGRLPELNSSRTKTGSSSISDSKTQDTSEETSLASAK